MLFSLFPFVVESSLKTEKILLSLSHRIAGFSYIPLPFISHVSSFFAPESVFDSHLFSIPPFTENVVLGGSPFP